MNILYGIAVSRHAIFKPGSVPASDTAKSLYATDTLAAGACRAAAADFKTLANMRWEGRGFLFSRSHRIFL